MDRIQKVKSILNSAYLTRRKMQNLELEIEALEDNLKDLIPSSCISEKVQTSRVNQSTYEYIILNKIETEKKFSELEKQYNQEKRKIEEVISRVDDSKDKLLLKCRYLYFYDWKSIALYIDVKEDYVFKIHRRILKKLAESAVECS